MPKNGPGINGDGLYATADRRKERGTAVRETRIGTQICLHVPFKIPVKRCRIEIVKQGRRRDGDILAG